VAPVGVAAFATEEASRVARDQEACALDQLCMRHQLSLLVELGEDRLEHLQRPHHLNDLELVQLLAIDELIGIVYLSFL